MTDDCCCTCSSTDGPCAPPREDVADAARAAGAGKVLANLVRLAPARAVAARNVRPIPGARGDMGRADHVSPTTCSEWRGEAICSSEATRGDSGRENARNGSSGAAGFCEAPWAWSWAAPWVERSRRCSASMPSHSSGRTIPKRRSCSSACIRALRVALSVVGSAARASMEARVARTEASDAACDAASRGDGCSAVGAANGSNQPASMSA